MSVLSLVVASVVPAVRALSAAPTAQPLNPTQVAINAFVATHADMLERYAGYELAERKLTGRVDGKEILDEAYIKVQNAAKSRPFRSTNTAALKSYFKTAIVTVIDTRPKLSESKKFELLAEGGKRQSAVHPSLENTDLFIDKDKDGTGLLKRGRREHIRLGDDPAPTAADHRKAARRTVPLSVFHPGIAETHEMVRMRERTIDEIDEIIQEKMREKKAKRGNPGTQPQPWESAGTTFADIALKNGVSERTVRRDWLEILKELTKRGYTMEDIETYTKYIPEPEFPVTSIGSSKIARANTPASVAYRTPGTLFSHSQTCKQAPEWLVVTSNKRELHTGYPRYNVTCSQVLGGCGAWTDVRKAGKAGTATTDLATYSLQTEAA